MENLLIGFAVVLVGLSGLILHRLFRFTDQDDEADK